MNAPVFAADGALTALLAGAAAEGARVALAEVHHEGADPPPRLLTRDALAAELSVSLSTVDRLRDEGLPTVWLGGDSPRFDLEDVVTWLKERGR